MPLPAMRAVQSLPPSRRSDWRGRAGLPLAPGTIAAMGTGSSKPVAHHDDRPPTPPPPHPPIQQPPPVVDQGCPLLLEIDTSVSPWQQARWDRDEDQAELSDHNKKVKLRDNVRALQRAARGCQPKLEAECEQMFRDMESAAGGTVSDFSRAADRKRHDIWVDACMKGYDLTNADIRRRVNAIAGEAASIEYYSVNSTYNTLLS